MLALCLRCALCARDPAAGFCWDRLILGAALLLVLLAKCSPSNRVGAAFRLQAVETADYDQPKAPPFPPLPRARAFCSSVFLLSCKHSLVLFCVFLSRLHICLPFLLHRRHPHPRCRIEQRLLDSCNPALTEKSISCISTHLPSLRPRVLTATTAATFRPPPPVRNQHQHRLCHQGIAVAASASVQSPDYYTRCISEQRPSLFGHNHNISLPLVSRRMSLL